ncbi:MAG: 23S rRNA (uracil(1939)-C(5))-methyltransferase RlmD [Oscillospiraceae bacterium]|nr:23S rRNA (uracil(1939)-C(5))-methyltransferase RlmD [Oscillospiraceae bacterium]
MEELKKNQIYDCEITSWSHDGAGVARIGGRAVFVPGAIPGERWRVRIVKTSMTAVFGRGEECLAPSPDRIVPDCSAYPKCGGCALRHVSYEAEKRFKLERVNEAYRRIGSLELHAEELLGAKETEAYRNKAIYTVNEGLRFGFYRPRSHDVIPIERCRLQNEASDRAAGAVCAFLREQGLPAYDERSGHGLVRRVFTRWARSTGALQVTVVAAGGFGSKTDALVEAVRRACPELSSLVLNVNKTRGNTVLSGDFHILWGSGVLTDTLCGSVFSLAPQSFYQVNPAQAERLYAKAVEYAAPSGTGTVLDLYCGAGTISLALAREAGRVIGVETVPEAIANARANAERNGVGNVEFLPGDAGEAAAELLRRGERPEAVVLDPPRKGLSTEVIEAVCAMSPERVVYVSCDVATQARDLREFTRRGYIPRCAAAVDMFPRTMHVETVVSLGLEKPDRKYMYIDYKPDHRVVEHGKATYQQIAEYVQEHFGLRVKSLDIAQVNDKCGLEKRQNYNLGAEGHRVPQVTQEKENALREALK